jgi:quinohemoprotein ethanol dehydrogenase
VLTFMLDGTATLPPTPAAVSFSPVADSDFRADGASAKRGEKFYAQYCAVCHGVAVIAGGHAPDLRASAVPLSAEAFKTIVQGGSLTHNGMPRFEEFSDDQLNDLREYIRTAARDAAQAH